MELLAKLFLNRRQIKILLVSIRIKASLVTINFLQSSNVYIIAFWVFWYTIHIILIWMRCLIQARNWALAK